MGAYQARDVSLFALASVGRCVGVQLCRKRRDVAPVEKTPEAFLAALDKQLKQAHGIRCGESG